MNDTPARCSMLSAGLAALSGYAAMAEAHSTRPPGIHLHWSRPAKILSPGGAWELTVAPVFTTPDNDTPVIVRKRGMRTNNVVLRLQRDAWAYWHDDDELLILDQPVANHSTVLLYRLQAGGIATRLRTPPDVNADLRARVGRALGNRRVIPFCLVRFGSWSGSRLVLTVAGTVVNGSEGPMAPWCYRVVVDSRTARIAGFDRATGTHPSDGAACSWSAI